MVPDPSYPNNFLNARILGGVTVPVPLREENGYQLEIEEFEKRLTPNTKMIVLTNPNNPPLPLCAERVWRSWPNLQLRTT